MARIRKSKKNKTGKSVNLPTQERFARGRIVIRNNVAKEEEPLRIDKLLRGGIIDAMQHLAGLQIITLWTIANRPFIKATQYERIGGSCSLDAELFSLTKMNGEDQFYKTIGFLKKRDHDLIAKICFDEMGAIEAGRALGLPVNSITVYVRAAFDALGNALARMRDVKRDLEKPKENVKEELV